MFTLRLNFHALKQRRIQLLARDFRGDWSGRGRRLGDAKNLLLENRS
jgi:hypothetical protein